MPHMGNSHEPCFIFITTLISFTSIPIFTGEAQAINTIRIIDLLIRDYTFKAYNISLPTGVVQSIALPANFSGINVDTAKFRCGSLRRYGAKLKEFRLGSDLIVQPCVERILLIRQNLGGNWSNIYYSNYNELSEYKLVTPILGLLAYNYGEGDPFELGVRAGKIPITIDFNTITTISNTANSSNTLCASFEIGGQIELKKPILQNTCESIKIGHYGLVVKSPRPPTPPPSPPQGVEAKKKISLRKFVVGITIGSALGLFLLGLLLVAMFVKVKEKAREEEKKRRAYEEEALQVSMAGHVVRAPVAPFTRTFPSIEHHYYYAH